MSATNFNYQVALKEGLKNLQQGRLRQAEQSFRYLVDKFPGAEGGYRGLAKVHFEQEDRTSALRVLREGAAALTKSGERSSAIGLLREAVALDARDLATHRRLAAALALAGDLDASVQEYARFIRGLRDSGEVERAKAEAAYARGQLKDAPGVSGLEQIATAEPAPVEEREPEKPSSAAPPPSNPTRSQQEADPWSARPPSAPLWSPGPSASQSLRDDPWAMPAAPMPAAPKSEPIVPASSERWNDEPSAPPAPVEAEAPSASEEIWTNPPAPLRPAPAAIPEPAPTESPDGNPAAVEAAAARYLATRDPRAAALALQAARYYISEGRTDAASDLLLQLIASGVADHDAQRLLVDVARTLGKRDVAKAKCQLLAQALLLDGRNDLAAEVEALAQTD